MSTSAYLLIAIICVVFISAVVLSNLIALLATGMVKLRIRSIRKDLRRRGLDTHG